MSNLTECPSPIYNGRHVRSDAGQCLVCQDGHGPDCDATFIEDCICEGGGRYEAAQQASDEAGYAAWEDRMNSMPVRQVCSNTLNIAGTGITEAQRHAAFDAHHNVEPVDPRSWVAVRQTPTFAVALDIARTERNSEIKLDVARQAVASSDAYEHGEAADAFTDALRYHRNDNNVLWGAARMLAAMVDDDELGALSVLRAELDRQDGV